jgi:hypothetical protein
MPNYRGIRPLIRWGSAWQYDVVFGEPLDRPVSWPQPGEGSAFVASPSGIEDSDVARDAHHLAGVVRRIWPDSRVLYGATGWNGHQASEDGRGWRDVLSWLRKKNIGRWYPDGRNVLLAPTMAVDTDLNGVVDSFTTSAIAAANATFSVNASAQKMTCAASAADPQTPGFYQDYLNVIPGETLSLSAEVQVAALVQYTTATLLLRFYDVSNAVLASFSTNFTDAAFARRAVSGAVAPALSSYARCWVYLAGASGAGASGQLWARKIQLERRSVASAAFVDQPGYKSVYLVEPMTGRPDPERDLTRTFPLELRTSDDSAFTGF